VLLQFVIEPLLLPKKMFAEKREKKNAHVHLIDNTSGFLFLFGNFSRKIFFPITPENEYDSNILKSRNTPAGRKLVDFCSYCYVKNTFSFQFHDTKI